jgi:ABC-type glutathione transport system ATPase component
MSRAMNCARPAPAAVPAQAARPGPDPGPAAALHGVTKVYRLGRGTVTALRDVDVVFPRGSFTAVMGASGSGKSTLLHCAAGLDRPTSGQVILAGRDLGPLREAQVTRLRRDRAGFVFQSFNLVPSLTVELNVALPARLAGRRCRRQEIRDALGMVGLAGRGARRGPGGWWPGHGHPRAGGRRRGAVQPGDHPGADRGTRPWPWPTP